MERRLEVAGPMQRRYFLRNAVIAGVAAALPLPSQAAESARRAGQRSGSGLPRLPEAHLQPEPTLPLPLDRQPRQLAVGGPPRLAGLSRRHVSLYNVHTGERLEIDYARDGRYRRDALVRLNQFLRDWRTGSVIDFDPEAIDILAALQLATRANGALHVLSGYRTQQTNDLLRRLGHDVARNSLHMQGMAIDICLPGYNLQGLRDQALALRAGGVGYYPDQGFIHVDTGSIRTWG